MHESVPQTGEWLQRVVTGYYQYHAVPGNIRPLSLFRVRLCRLWRHVLRRRSQTAKVSWDVVVVLLIGGSLRLASCIRIPMRVSTPVSELGAVCGSSARTDLRGGRPAMAVPTASVPSMFDCLSDDR